jgi:Ribbon-helix-helix protein, copG family
MTVLKPRSRMISVRLSEEEYAALRHLCSLTGARSVSDLTRDAVHTVLRGVNREDSLGIDLEEFRAGMKNLERKVEQLEAKITMFKSDGNQ